MAPKNIKLIPQNPLAVIAALIGVVEAAFAYPVTRLTGANQTIFVAFMVGFPFFLVFCFFLTVWFKPGHLYAPKDYSKDESFLAVIRKIPAISSSVSQEQGAWQAADPRSGPTGAGA